mmetsp:Transcript_24291/g.59671  ORF Transcript_24291/g.59671 Transcript_24291/m.59671 type:complete len:213 (-) Transcript_24291:281-919(-)
MQAEGVAACAKHWPGHGDTTEDSHDMLPSLPHSVAHLEGTEMKPFAAAIAADVASVMVAHLLVPAMESPGVTPVPASCSIAVVAYLRDRMGYTGMVMTDDMEMGALKAYGVSKAAVQGVAAGVDMLLVCHTEALQLEVVDAVASALLTGELTAAQVAAATGRIAECCARFCRPPPPPEEAGGALPPDPLASELVGTATHRSKIADVLQSSKL